jgi:hypothetical protein
VSRDGYQESQLQYDTASTGLYLESEALVVVALMDGTWA